MNLTLYPVDLKEEFQEQVSGLVISKLNITLVTYDTFGPEAQRAVSAVGRGMYKAQDGQGGYTIIYAPVTA